MHANVVIALGSENTLPAILSHIHQAGFGQNAFVLRPRRSSIQRQLDRLGIPTGRMPGRVDAAEAALVIHAAARAASAADITRQHGASATWIVAPNGTWNLVDDDVAPARHDVIPSPVIVPSSGIVAVPDETPDI
jgi:hypothetical protein